MTQGATIARQVRTRLALTFRGTEFSTRTRNGSVSVSWTDGPRWADVDAVAARFAQISRDAVTGEILCGGNCFVTCSRAFSPVFLRSVADRFCRHFGLEPVEVREDGCGGAYVHDDGRRFGSDWLCHAVANEASNTDAR